MKQITEMARRLFGRRQAYINVFDNPNGEKVLKDLAQFCRATESTFHADPRLHAVAEGRREVFLRIMDHLKMSEDDLYGKYK